MDTDLVLKAQLSFAFRGRGSQPHKAAEEMRQEVAALQSIVEEVTGGAIKEDNSTVSIIPEVKGQRVVLFINIRLALMAEIDPEIAEETAYAMLMQIKGRLWEPVPASYGGEAVRWVVEAAAEEVKPDKVKINASRSRYPVTVG